MKKILIFCVLFLIVFLLIPYLLNEKKPSLENFESIKAADLNYTEVSFSNKYDGTKLSGMIFLPEQSEHCPFAVIIQGSGCSNRDNSWYLDIVRHLQNNGIAVFLPDKRGCGK